MAINPIAELTTEVEEVTTLVMKDYVTLRLTKEQAALVLELIASIPLTPLESLYYALNRLAKDTPGMRGFMDYPATEYGYTLTRTPVFEYDESKRTVAE